MGYEMGWLDIQMSILELIYQTVKNSNNESLAQDIYILWLVI